MEVERFPLNQNGKCRDRARLAKELAVSAEEPAKRTSHDLHESRSVAELRDRLRRRDIDLVSLVNEFVKPTARFGLLVRGALPEGTATEVSPLELLVLLDDGNAMKRRKPEVAGRAVEYLGGARAGRMPGPPVHPGPGGPPGFHGGWPGGSERASGSADPSGR